MIANKAAKTAGLPLYGVAHIKGVNDGILTLSKVSNDKKVSISSEGSITQVDDGEIESEKNIALTEGTDLTSSKGGALKSCKKITLKAEDVKQDGINIFGKETQLLVGKDIDLTARAGDIKIEDSVTSNKGNVEMSIDTGNLNIEKILRAKKGNVDIAIGEGNIQIGNDTTKVNGTTILETNGDITIANSDGNIRIDDNGSEDMLSAQNDLDL